MLKTIALKPAEMFLNQYIKLDPSALERLHMLDGRTLEVAVQPTGIIIHMNFKSDRVTLTPATDQGVDASLSGTPFGFIQLFCKQDKSAQFKQGHVKLHGNAEFAQKANTFFSELDADWESFFAKLIGDSPAYALGRGLKKIGEWGQSALSSFGQNTKEFFTDEVDMVAQTHKLDDFYREVDELRSSTDRLEARIQHLESTLTTKDHSANE